MMERVSDAADAADAAEVAGFPGLLASDSEGPAGIAVDAAYVYWANYVSGNVWRVPKSGGMAELLCTVVRSGVIDLAIDDAYLYLTAPPEPGVGTVGLLRVAKGGGSLEVLSRQEFNAHSLAIDGGELFWMTGTVDATGGAHKMDLATKQVTTLAEGFLATGHLTFDESDVYFAVGRPKGQGKIVRVSRRGGVPAALTSSEQGPFGIWNDAQFVYWTDGFYEDSDSRAIKRLAKNASSATAPEILRSVPDPPALLMGDSSNIYWHDFPSDRIWELPKVPPGVPRQIATGFNLADLALDTDFIYWVNISPPRGGVYRTAK